MNINKTDALDSDLSKALKKEVIAHKQQFTTIYTNKLKEEMPSLIGIENSDQTSIDVLYMQWLLRNNYNVVLGEDNRGEIVILGTIKSLQPLSQFASNQVYEFTHDDIQFIAPERVRLDVYASLTYYNNDGNCVVITNKINNYVSDDIVINHYVKELAEIAVSRYSLSIQARFLTFINSDEPESQNIRNLISDIYNGNPFPIVDSNLSIMDEVIKVFDDSAFSANSAELKSEFQNKLSELNHLIGVQSLSVEKKSGVSNDEARGNKSSTIGFGNVYLKSQQMGLNLLNKKYGLDLKAMFYNDLESEENAHYSDVENSTNEGGDENL